MYNFKSLGKAFNNHLRLILQILTYNLKIIFANKFIYFLLGAFAFYLLIAITSLFDPTSYFSESEVYNLLLFPGLLVVFYPSTFGIQNDVDTRMIEVLFGIPNYRYKVWLLRLLIIFFVVFVIMLILSILSSLALITVPILEISYHLMFPICFLGCLGFLLSTIIRNGSGTAAIMVLLGLVVWISTGIMEETKWNVFFNPYSIPKSLSQLMWSEILFYNRLYLFIGSILAILGALFRLQSREKFI